MILCCVVPCPSIRLISAWRTLRESSNINRSTCNERRWDIKSSRTTPNWPSRHEPSPQSNGCEVTCSMARAQRDRGGRNARFCLLSCPCPTTSLCSLLTFVSCHAGKFLDFSHSLFDCRFSVRYLHWLLEQWERLAQKCVITQ